MTLRIQGSASDTAQLFAGELNLSDVVCGDQNRMSFVPASTPQTVVVGWKGPRNNVCSTLIETLIDDPSVNVLIWPRPSQFGIGGVSLCEVGVVVDDGYLAPGFVLVAYDHTDCDGNGYAGYDASGAEIPMPPSALLMYGLASAATFSPDAWAIAGSAMPASPTVDPAKSLIFENLFRGLKLMTARDGATDLYGRTCPAQPHRRVVKPGSMTDPPPSKSTTGGHVYVLPKCFVATAAYGSPFTPEVEFLRDVRDQVLTRTRTGDRFFRRFYEHYYRISPQLAAAAREDDELAGLLRVGVVEPLVLWLRTVLAMPGDDLDGVPEPWREFLTSLRADAERWAEQIGLPDSFGDIAPFDAVTELAVVLRFMLHDPGRRAAYLDRLSAAGELPLALEPQRHEDAVMLLRDSGRSDGEIEALIGARA
jgi:hypothetical protein